MYYETVNKEGQPRVRGASVILKEQNLDNHAHTYNFVFNVRLTPDKMFEAANWCEKNIIGDWLVGSTHSGIDNKKDAFAFKMMWT